MGMPAKDSVPGAVPTGDVHERAGLGLLSRFVGAVFLILLAGLLLLDRALLRADRSEAKLDAQASALLTESYIADAYRVVGGFAVALRAQRLASLDSLAASLREIEAIWVRSSTGDSVVYMRGLVARNDPEHDLTTVPARTAAVRIVRLGNRPASRTETRAARRWPFQRARTTLQRREAGQSGQERVSREHIARASHTTERHRRLC